MRPSLARRSVIAGALLLPLAAAAQQVFINAPAPLYAGPAPGYPVVASLYPGVELSVVGCVAGYEWCDVVLADGLRGWIFGPYLSYAWMGNALPVPQYGPSLGIPQITFIVSDYWGRHYRQQPWYGDSRWHQPPPQRLGPLPPPRWEREGPPPGWGREPHREPYRESYREQRWNDAPPRGERNEPPRPQREITLPPRPERDAWRAGNGPAQPGVPAVPAVPPSPAVPAQPPRPDGGRQFAPRPAPEAAPQRPDMRPSPGTPFGGWAPSAAPRPDHGEAPRPQRETVQPPGQPHPPGEPNRGGGPGGRPDGPRPGFQ